MKNQSIKTFPELNFDQLRHYAQNWVKQLEKHKGVKILSVALYGYDSSNEARWRHKVRGNWPITKYAVIFEYTGCDNLNDVDVEGYPNENDDECTSFLKEIIHANQFPNYHGFIDDLFHKRVYSEFDRDYKITREWIFIPKRYDEMMPPKVLNGDLYWILFYKDLEIPEDIQQLIHKAYPEIFELYEVIKDYGITKDWSKLQRVAISHIKRYKQRFKVVKAEHLESIGLTHLVVSNERRSFVGHLIKRILTGCDNLPDTQKSYIFF